MAYEPELPAVYLDALVLDSSPATLEVISRAPEPGETGVSKSAHIELTLVVTVAGQTISVPSTTVEVNGSSAFAGGAFTPDFSGSGSRTETVSGPTDMLRIVLDRTSDFESESVVTVRVQSVTNLGAALDETYQFTIEDLTAPKVVSAQALSHTTVKVSFDDVMKMTDAAASDDALNPANYTVTPLEFPAVTPVVTLVRALTDQAVELTLDVRASFSKTYRVTVVNAEDTSGNAVVVPFNTADFVAPACSKPAERDFNVYRMLPQMNRSEDETLDLFKFASCLQEVVDLLLCEVDRFSDFIDPDTTTADGIRAMLADLGNPFAFDLSEEDERRLVTLLVPLYKQKGTDPGIRNAVRLFLGLDITLTGYLGEGLSLGESELGVDWVLGPSTSFMKYAFDVNVDVVLTEEQMERLRAIVMYMKPAHTHLINVNEPEPPTVVDHLELGLSELGVTWELH